MQNATDIRSIGNAAPHGEEVLSPESYVFVALMSVEEGPNKAGSIELSPDEVGVAMAHSNATPPSTRTTTTSGRSPCRAEIARIVVPFR